MTEPQAQQFPAASPDAPVLAHGAAAAPGPSRSPSALPPPEKAAVRVSAGFMLRHPAHILAMGFGSGLSSVMPGTAGTLLGWLMFAVLSRWLQPVDWLILIGAGFLIGVWACTRTGDNLGAPDHGSMVWDEIIAIWLVLVFVTPAGFWAQFWAVAWFRFFDMVKPPPIRKLDRAFKRPGWVGGFGVMIDDIVAAFFTLLVIAVWRVI